MLLIDSDAHVIESEATWQYLDPAYHERRPIAVTVPEDPELDAALKRSYNDFMSKQCVASGGRLFFDMVRPFRLPEIAVDEIRRVKRMGGAVAVLARRIEYDKPLDHPSFYPIYAEAERQNLAMVVHLGRGSPAIEAMFEGQIQPTTEGKTFFPPRGRRLVSTLVAQFGFYSVLETALIEHFPKLRWVLLESGGLEFAISALSTIGRAGPIDRRRFFDEGRVFMGCEPDEDINLVAAKIGAGAILVSSDMPHFDEAAHHDVAEEFHARGDLSPELLERMFRTNALRAFDFAAAAPARTAEPRAKAATRVG